MKRVLSRHVNEEDMMKQVLKLFIKKKNISYQYLADALHLSVATIGRSLTTDPLTLTRLLEYCQVLDISFQELMDLCKNQKNETFGRLNEAQDAFLAQYPVHRVLYYFLLMPYTQLELKELMGVDDSIFNSLIDDLENQKLIHRSKWNIETMNFSPLPTGPLLANHINDVRQFLNDQLEEYFSLLQGDLSEEEKCQQKTKKYPMAHLLEYELTPSSLYKLIERLNALFVEFEHISRSEAQRFPKEELQSCAFFSGIFGMSFFKSKYFLKKYCSSAKSDT